MNLKDEHEQLRIAEGNPHPNRSDSSAPSPPARRARGKMGIGQKIIVVILLIVVTVPPTAAFYSYFSGVPLHLLAGAKDKEEREERAEVEAAARSSVTLVPREAHSINVSPEVCNTLGIMKGGRDSIAVAQVPSTMRPLMLPGSTALDPTRLARVRARFAPARVVQLAKIWDYNRKTGHTEPRELRPGDPVAKGDVLGVFYSVDVGSKKNDLLNALVQLMLDQKVFDKVEENRMAIPEVLFLTQQRNLQTDRNEVNRALNNLTLWDIPQEEIDALHAEAKKISSNKDAWYQTPEGQWVQGKKQSNGNKNGKSSSNGGGPLSSSNGSEEVENPWGRVTLRAPFDGVIVERNVHKDEMVIDNTVNLFQIADVSRLLVLANCPEDQLPALEALEGTDRKWTVRTVNAWTGTNALVGTEASTKGIVGTIDEIGYMIDPNQHTAVIKGYIENPGKRIRGGQYVSATIQIPAPDDVVEIPSSAVVDDGRQCIVFIQPKEGSHTFTMRRVDVTQRFENTVFVRRTKIAKEDQLTASEAEEGLLPKQPLESGALVLTAGVLELKATLIDLESQPENKPKAELSSLEEPKAETPKAEKAGAATH
jgi:cobalt-zinc-cadmium efflux system membrane fusion protein